MRRFLVPLAAVAVLTALGWFLTGIGSEGRGESALAGTSSTEATRAPAVELEAAAASAADAPATASRSRAVPDAATASATSASELEATAATPAKPLARGTLVVRDRAGRTFPSEDGTLVVASPDGERVVPVRGGAFEVEARRKSLFDKFGEGRDFWVESAVLGGRTTLLDQQPQLWGDETYALTAEWPARLELRVVSSVDGRDLDGVDVVGDLSRFSHTGHPGADWELDVVARGALSPLVLPPPANERIVRNNPFRTYLVRAPGHAWTAVLLNLEEGGSATAELLPGGHLAVHCAGHDPSRALTLELRPTDGEHEELRSLPPFEPDAKGSLRLESLAAGAWRLQAVLATPTNPRLVIAERGVVIEAGAETRVDLALELPVQHTTVALGGSVVYPKGYGGSKPKVMVRAVPDWESAGDGYGPSADPLGPCKLLRISGAERTWGWSAGEVPQGLIEVSVQGTGVTRRLELGPRGATDVELVCPPPATVELLVRSSFDGRPLKRADELSLLPLVGPPWSMLEYGTLERDQDENVYRGVVAPGSYRVAVYELGRSEGDARIHVQPGHNAFELTVSPSNLLRLRLLRGDAPVAADSNFFERAEQDGVQIAQNAVYMNSMESEITFGLLGQGRMTVHLRAPVGYQPIEPVEIDLLPGEVTEVDVQVRELE